LPNKYESHLKAKLPSWVLDTWGARFFGVIGRFFDLAWEDVYEGTRARYAAKAPEDALPYAVRDADVPVFEAFDTIGQIRARAQDPWGWHERQGTEPGFDDLVGILRLDPAATWYLDTSNGPHWFLESWWSLFAVVTKNPTGWGLRTDTWDEWGATGATWNDVAAAGESWGFTAPATVFSTLREFLWTRRWGHALPVYVSFLFGDGFSWDELKAASTTWDAFASFTWDEAGDVQSYVMQTGRMWHAFNLEGGNAPLTWDQMAATGTRWDRLMTTRD
jgi:hypothetical protein